MCKKVKEIFMYNYGTLHLRINEILADKGISKNKICKDLDIPRSNFNRYCRDEFQRMDTNLICKLCNYLDVDISTLIEYNKPNTTTPE
jgi:DNA-binding Xre family transcriptional regulator